jgi:hypothetical protein
MLGIFSRLMAEGAGIVVLHAPSGKVVGRHDFLVHCSSPKEFYFWLHFSLPKFSDSEQSIGPLKLHVVCPTVE